MTRQLLIGTDEINEDSGCYVIAEIGHNHQGSVEQAKQLIEEAKSCGAHAVKFQKRDNRALYTAEFFAKPYDHENSFAETYGEHREALEFDRAQYMELRDFAEELDVTFFATPFDLPSVDFLAGLDIPAYKVASADLKNPILLKAVAELGKPMIISTGAATLDDVRRAYEIVTDTNPEVAVLQCTAGYPAAWNELDLRVIETYQETFPRAVVGLSSHDSGIAMAVAAYVLGARIIEKHFTLNRAMKGTDHRFSLEPQGLRKMVRDLRRTRLALGDGTKRMHDSEAEPITKMGKKLVAGRDLAAGATLGADDVEARSPGDGLPPNELETILGLRLRENIPAGSALTLGMFEAVEADSVTPVESG